MATNGPKMVIDAFQDFGLGMNSDLDAYIIPPNQASFLVNCTVRGLFSKNRPPYQNQNLLGAVWQTINSVGIFQGAEYCAPDTGQQFLIAQIGGRLFTFTPSTTDIDITVEEVSIPGDLNPAGLPQAWLCQAERWVIIQNGVNNAIAFDSTTKVSRRLIPTSSVQATTDPASVTPTGQFVTPVIGGTVDVPFAALGNNIANFINQTIQLVEYDNSTPPNVTATTNWEVLSVNGSTTIYNITLKNLGDTAGAIQGSGSGLSIQPSNIGNIVSAPGTFVVGPNHHAKLTLTMSSPVPAYLAVNQLVSIAGDGNWKVTDISGSRLVVKLEYAIAGYDIFLDPNWPGVAVVGYPVYSLSNTQPSTQIGTLAANLTAPAVGATVTTTLLSSYTGALNQILFVNAKQYQVTAFSTTTTPPVTPNTALLLNLNDSRLGHVFNAVVVPPVSPTVVYNFPELPPGRMMAYCQNHLWESLTDALSFIAGDVAGGPAGSPACNFRDAVLKVSENTYLANGGAFRVPSNLGQIAAMRTSAQLDAALGQGALMVVTPGGIFSCNAPADRTLWASLTTPIVSESLIGLGGLSQNSTIVVNGDLIFRAVDGIRSLIMAKREFYSWGNTPISVEMNRVLSRDNPAGLPFSSAVQFDNRMLMTASPIQGPQGVYHAGLIALNFDPVSTIQGKSSSVYDGLWTGLNILQIIEGQFSGVHRCFAFTQNTSLGKIEIYELLKDGSLDNGTSQIVSIRETSVLLKSPAGKVLYDLCSLEDGEIYVKGIAPGQTVDFKVEYRPDFSSCWFPWHEFTYCNSDESVQQLYGARLGLGKPQSIDNSAGSDSSNNGRWFQFRITIRGGCVFMGMKVSASVQPQAQFAPVISVAPTTPIQCQ